MKKLILFTILQLIIGKLSSQVVIEQVNFDNPNDQSDYFYGSQSLVQIPTNGVTGGCLLVPDSNNWGNDNSRYCSKYKAQDTMEYITRIMFYYSDLVSNPNSFDRPVSIWLSPFADPNHYVIASLTHDKKIELLSYFSANSSFILTLNNNYWYELSLTVRLNGDSVMMNLFLLDRGANGQMPPIPVDFINSAIDDSVFARDNAIEVAFTGSKNGGSIYLDNFSFNGHKSADSCLTTNISSISRSSDNVRLINLGKFLKIINHNSVNEKFIIYNLMGELVQSGILRSDDNLIDVSSIKSGFYLMRLSNSKKTFKFIISG